LPGLVVVCRFLCFAPRAYAFMRSATAKTMLLTTADAPVIAPNENTDRSSPVPKSFMVPSSRKANPGFTASVMTTRTTYMAELYQVLGGEADIFSRRNIKYTSP